MTSTAPSFARVVPHASAFVYLARAASRRRWWAVLALFVAATLASKQALAAGFFLTDRGVRPLSRGGAFVAGADDLGSVWYNPAGLSETGDQIMVDASYIQFNASFARTTVVTGSSGEPTNVSFPKVEAQAPFLPLPTIAGSTNFGLPTWNFAFAIHAPYTPLADYPDEIDDGSPVLRPAPQRYSLLSPKGSLLSVIGLYASKTFLDEKLAIGLGPELLLGEFVSRVALSSCPPDRLLCAEQDPAYDSITQLKAGIIAAPSLSFGARYSITEKWRVGFSGHLPFWVDTPAKIVVQLPSAALFNGVSVRGDQARVKFRLPLILRLGVEFRPVKEARIEATGVYESWSMHDKIEINSVGSGVQLLNIPGFPASYRIGDMAIARGFRDTFSLRLGGEYGRPVGEKFGYSFRAGVMYERSAIPSQYLTVLTIDMDKVVPALGFSLRYGGLSFDITYAHVFTFGGDVNPATAKVTALNPVRGNNGVAGSAVNGGKYTMDANIIGLGVSYRFDVGNKSSDNDANNGQDATVKTIAPAAEEGPLTGPATIERRIVPVAPIEAKPEAAPAPAPSTSDDPPLVAPKKNDRGPLTDEPQKPTKAM